MNRLIRENKVHKKYLCITVGVPKERKATLYGWHKKSASHNTVTVRDTPEEGFQEIITAYEVLAFNERHALLSVDLITGRTHQIRAHLAHIHAPILGDTKYGNMRENRALHCKHQLLWAYQLQLETDSDSCLANLNGLTVQTPLPEVLCRNAAGVSRRAGEPVEVKYILDPKDFSGHPAANLFVKSIDTILQDPEMVRFSEPKPKDAEQ